MTTDAKIRRASIHILKLIVEKRYQDLIDLAENPGIHSLEGLRNEAESYPGTKRLCTLDEVVYYAYPSESEPGIYLIDVPVFTTEDGETDLTAKIKVVDEGQHDYKVVFCDLLSM